MLLARSRTGPKLSETLPSAIDHWTERGIASFPETNELLVMTGCLRSLAQLFVDLRLTQMRGRCVCDIRTARSE